MLTPEEITKLREALEDLGIVYWQQDQAKEALTILDKLLEDRQKWLTEYLNASQDAMNFARKLNELEAQGKTPDETLEHAWQRICYGKVDYDVNEPVSNLMRMFDYPRYTWDQLHDLIKGIKR